MRARSICNVMMKAQQQLQRDSNLISEYARRATFLGTNIFNGTYMFCICGHSPYEDWQVLVLFVDYNYMYKLIFSTYFRYR